MARVIRYLENGVYKYATVKDIGELEKLQTKAKTDIVSAINELFNGGGGGSIPEGLEEKLRELEDNQTSLGNEQANLKQSQDEAKLAQEQMIVDLGEVESYLDQVKTELDEDVADVRAQHSALREEKDLLQEQVNSEKEKLDGIATEMTKKLDSEKYNQDYQSLTEDISKKAGLEDLANQKTEIISRIDTDIASQQAEIETAKTSITELSEKTGALEKDIISKVDGEVYNEKILEIDTTTSGITQKVGLVEGKINTAQGSISELESSVSTISQTQDGIALEVEGVKTNVTDQGKAISSHSSSITALQDEITSKVEAEDVYTKNVVDEKLGQKVESTTYNNKMSEIKQTTDGISQTVSQQTTKLDGVDGKVTEHSSKITNLTQDVNGITATVSAIEGDIDGVTGRMSSAESKITANATAINLRATKDEVEDLTGRVTSAEAEIDVQAGQITQRVTKDEFEDSVGVNKWISSRYLITGTDLSAVAPTLSLISGKTASLVKEISDNSTLAIDSGNSQITHLFTNVRLDSAKTISLTVKYNSSLTILVNGASVYSNKSNSQTAVTVSLSLRAGWNTIEILHGLVSGQTPVLQLGVKLSSQVAKMTTTIGVGNKDETRMTNAETNIKQTQDAIELKAEKTVVDNLGNRVGTAESSLQVQAGQIASKVENSTFNNYTKRVENAESSITQLSKSIELKVDSEDFDTLNSKVTTQDSSITALNTSVNLKANQSVVDTLNQKVTNNTAQLEIQAGQIEAKVGKTDFDKVAGRVTSAETRITQTEKSITSKAEASNVYTKTEADGRITTNVNNAKSEIKQTTDSISQKVTGLTTTVSGHTSTISSHSSSITSLNSSISLKAEAKNVYTKTETDGKVSSAVSTAKSEIAITTNGISQRVTEVSNNLDNLEIGDRNLLLKSDVITTNNEYCIASYNPSEFLIAGETYTVTLCITPAEKVKHFTLYLSSGYTSPATLNVSGIKKQIISKTFVASYATDRTPEDNPMFGDVQMYRFPNDSTVTAKSTLHWIKVVKGNKSTTDYTPAPEDIENRMSTAETGINQTKSDITLLAKKTDVYTKAEADGKISSSVATAKSEIKQTTDSISQTVSSLNTTVSGHTTSINSHTTSITSMNNSINLKANASNVYTKTEADGKISTAITNAKADIKITTDSITSKVTAVEKTASSLGTRMTSAESSITQTKTDITSKVSKTDYTGATVVSMINQTADSVKIQAKNIEFTAGSVTFNALASDAQTKINTATNNASSAVSTASTASTNASNAVKTANTASTNATNAVSTANTANSNATTAKSDASTAKSNASSAVSTANTANSNASNAVTRVGQVEGKINNAVTTIDGTGVTVKDGSFFLKDNVTDAKYSIVSQSNLILDHSFELVHGNWSNYVPTYGWMTIVDPHAEFTPVWSWGGTPNVHVSGFTDFNYTSPFGNKSISVRENNYVRQKLQAMKNRTYTLSAYFKRPMNAASGGVPKFEVWHHDDVGARVKSIAIEYLPAVKADYSVERRSTTFTTPSNMGEYDGIEVVINGGNSYWVQVDGVQLVEGAYPVLYDPEESLWSLATGGMRANEIFADRVESREIAFQHPSSINFDGYGNIRGKETASENANWNVLSSDGVTMLRVPIGSNYANYGVVNLSLKNGWTHYGGYQVPRARKDSSGYVHLEGLVRNGSGEICTLPSGYRPDGSMVLIVAGNDGSDSLGRVNIHPSGGVQYMNGGNKFISLSNIPPFYAGW